MMQLSHLLQLKQWHWPSLMFSLSSSPLFHFLAWGSLHEVLACETSGYSNDNVFTELPPWGRRSPYHVSIRGSLRLVTHECCPHCLLSLSVRIYNIRRGCGKRRASPCECVLCQGDQRCRGVEISKMARWVNWAVEKKWFRVLSMKNKSGLPRGSALIMTTYMQLCMMSFYQL